MSMGNEKQFDNITDFLTFAFEQMLKNIYTIIPAHVISYNSETKRAIVRPSIKIETSQEIISQSPIANVPVVFPCGGGFTLLSPLPAGSPVLLFFSQRGITKFKQSFEEVAPDENLFDKQDAIAVAGFGSLSVTPATEDGISLQSEDGTKYIFIEDDKIEISHPATLNLIAPAINLTGEVIITGNLTVAAGGIITGDLPHTHAQGRDSDGDTEQDTGAPIYP
jgi:hypothetical protein